MNWQEVRIKADQATIETISNVLHEMGVGGIVIEDPALIQQCIEQDSWDYYDAALSQSVEDSEGEVIVKTYLPMNENLPHKLEELRNELDYLRHNYYPAETFEIVLTEVSEKDWANSWKAYYKPEKIGEKIVIKPSWEDYESKAGELIIELDPGMAFGTGNHPTTSMCIKALERYVKATDQVYDVGCGSGVLAISAALLGAKEVVAVDIDEVAVKVARENVELNQVQGKVKVLQGNLLDLVKEPGDLIVANIIADIIISVCPDVIRALKDSGYFIASGIIRDRKDDVLAAFAEANLKVVECIEEGEWVALVSTKGV